MPTLTPPDAVSDALRHFDGQLLRPADHGYDAARRLWNGMFDVRPALIAACVTPADVQSTVRAARTSGLPLAVRGGGHSVAGFGTVADGIVLDLRGLSSVRVDPGARVAVVGGGATWAQVDAATQRFGLATPGGVVSDTGVGGLTLGGGLGWLRRACGLSCDNLVAAELVTASGDLLHVDEATRPDVLWGLRGGGGNLGVVTSFTFRLHPVGPRVWFTFVLYPLDAARDVLLGHDAFLRDGREEISTLAVLGRVPAAAPFPPDVHGKPFVGVLGLHAGPPGEGELAMLPLRRLHAPLADLSARTTYVAAQQILDEDYPSGDRYYWKSMGLPALTPEVIDLLVEHARRAPSDRSTIDLWLNGGAMGRTPEDATAWAGRGTRYLVNPEANWSDPADDAANVAWARACLADLERFGTGGLYLNFPGFLEEGERLVRAGLAGNADRLAALKAELDPGNLFRRNANLRPG